ncbi:MAG: ATP-grasp domain-containing protein, partial [Planctomycetota bacterium]
VPVIPGTDAAIGRKEDLEGVVDEIGYPFLIKAAAGGGGKGIRRVDSEKDLASAWERSTSEAGAAFGDRRVYLERLVNPARHVEAQIFGDGRGNAVFLGERECSLQRHHQKLLEETPSPSISEEVREEMRKAALAGVRAIEYRGAGTIEFLYDDGRGEFYFLEMNTRLQVEHPVTEMVTGHDLVAEQLAVAAGKQLADGWEAPRRGWSMEYRVYAEDPYRGFLPSTGTIEALRLPHVPFTRIDAALREGYEVSPYYDPLLCKMISWGETRREAIRRLERLLVRTRIGGLHTTVPLGIEICRTDAFQAGEFHTRSLEEWLDRSHLPTEPPAQAICLAAIIARHALSREPSAGQPEEPPDGGRSGWAARLEGTGRSR